MLCVLRPLAAAALVAALTGPVAADCLAMREARALIEAGEVIPLAAALRSARGAVAGEMIDGRLCRNAGGYQYLVTFLGPEGRVVRVSVDARSGTVQGIR
jgi:uncharacterized membrane protein YkoI